MSESQEWIKAFNISSGDLGKLHSQADPSLSLLHTSLLEQIVPENEYLEWASAKYLLPKITPAFSAQAVDVEELGTVSGLFPWRQDLFPVGLWGNTLYLLCHEPSALNFEGYRVQFVLAGATVMKTIWSALQASMSPETSAQPSEEPLSESASTNTKISDGSTASTEATQTASAFQSEPSGDRSPAGKVQEPAADTAQVPEGISLNTQTETAASQAPEGISLSTETEAAATEAPEGIQLGGTAEVSFEAPEGMQISADSLTPSGSDQPSAEETLAEESESEGEAPEGISLNAAAPDLSFASLTNPVEEKAAPSEPEAPVEPQPAPQAAKPQPAPAAQAAAPADEAEDAPPVMSFGPPLEADTPAEPPAKPKVKVSPALAALKVKPDEAASLPPVPQPFGAAPAASKAEPVTAPAAAQTPVPQVETPAPAAQTQAPAPVAADNPQVVKSEWSFTEVSKVTPLKQEPQTVSRTLEFTHLSTSGNSADLEMCKALSHDEIEKASDDPRKAGNIAEVALNTFKVMKTYYPDSIFFVFLGSNLIPWRWTQNWSRKLDTPPGPIDLSTPSIFRIAFQTGLPYHGYVVPSPVNESFFKEWNGGVLPDHVTLMPIKIGNLIAGMLLGRADRASIDYKYSLKYMEGLAVNISQALQDISVKSAS